MTAMTTEEGRGGGEDWHVRRRAVGLCFITLSHCLTSPELPDALHAAARGWPGGTSQLHLMLYVPASRNCASTLLQLFCSCGTIVLLPRTLYGMASLGAMGSSRACSASNGIATLGTDREEEEPVGGCDSWGLVRNGYQFLTTDTLSQPAPRVFATCAASCNEITHNSRGEASGRECLQHARRCAGSTWRYKSSTQAVQNCTKSGTKAAPA